MTIEALIQYIAAEVRTVPGVRALALGGSRARGTHNASSDIDLGIYYHSHQELDIDALAAVAAKLDDERRTELITPPGGWGPWINGGGWLRIQSHPVDFLYRDVTRVAAAIDTCLAGTITTHYQPGHPHGFVSAIYLGEIAICRPLWDPDGIIASLKTRVVPYPSELQQAIIHHAAWEIDFSIGIARKSVARVDLAYAAGCCFRSVMCMLEVLFALNREYWLNEKGAVAIANRFANKPPDVEKRINEVFASLRATPESIQRSIALLEALNADIQTLQPQ